MPAKRLSSAQEVAVLAERLLSDSRVRPIVVVTTRHKEAEPLIEADRLAEDVAPVPVYVVETGELTWDLTSLLPDGLGVYGGAARIWWPGLTRAARPYAHPLIFAYTRAEGLRAAQRICEDLARHHEDGERDWSLWQRKQLRPDESRAPKPPVARQHRVGAVVSGTVVHATPGGVEVHISTGLCGWLVRRRRDPALAVGDQVDVRVVAYDGNEVFLERAPRVRPSAAAGQAGPPRPRAGPPQSRSALTCPQERPAHPSVAVNEASKLQAEIAELRLQLQDAQEYRRLAEVRAEDAAAELTRAVKAGRRTVQEQRRELRSLRDRVRFLEARLRGTGRFDDAEDQFRHEVQVAWENMTVGDDRKRWPLQDYLIGPFFLASVEALEGLTRTRIVDVCTEVVTGRIAGQPGRGLHPLREDDSPASAQRVREDGAKAYRVALQTATSAARRLHFWRLPDGRVELSKVGVHDDFSIL